MLFPCLRISVPVSPTFSYYTRANYWHPEQSHYKTYKRC